MAPRTYDANCHCGAVRYTVTLDDALAPEGTTKVTQCNCSICTKYAMNTMTFICGNECSKLPGYLLVYPKRSDVQLLGDSETKLKQYFFGQKRKPHLFCGECSSNVMIDFAASESEKQRPFLAMNVRSFRDIDLEGLEYTTVDGWNKLEPQYSS